MSSAMRRNRAVNWDTRSARIPSPAACAARRPHSPSIIARRRIAKSLTGSSGAGMGHTIAKPGDLGK
jgi:hypothetical protein